MGNAAELKKVIKTWWELTYLAQAVIDNEFTEKYNGNDLDGIEDALIEILRDYYYTENDNLEEAERKDREDWKANLQYLFEYKDKLADIAVKMLSDINSEEGIISKKSVLAKMEKAYTDVEEDTPVDPDDYLYLRTIVEEQETII